MITVVDRMMVRYGLWAEVKSDQEIENLKLVINSAKT